MPPKLIAAAPFRGAGPRPPKVRLSDLPKGSVRTPGSSNYDGNFPKAEREAWQRRAESARRRGEPFGSRRWAGRWNYGIAAGMVGTGVAGGGAVVALGHRNAKKIRATPLDQKVDLTSKKPVRKALRPHPSMPLVNEATVRRGVHRVTSMPSRWEKIREKERRFAHWAGGESGGAALAGAGTVGGFGALTAGAVIGSSKVKRAQEERRAAQRKAKRGTLTPVAKSRGGAAYMLRNVRQQVRPSALARSQLTSPQTLGFTALGGGALEGGRERRARGGRGTTTTERAALGAVGGQAAYQGATYGSNALAMARHGSIYKDPSTRRGYKDPGTKKTVESHKSTYRSQLRDGDFKEFYRTFPLRNREGKKIPGSRHLRINAHLTTGRRGWLVGAGTTVGGAIAASQVGRGRKPVAKALYAREDRVSPVRALELAAGATLAAYGLGHSGAVGRALARGVKIAQRNGNEEVAAALLRAEAARGSIRAGMAPGEAALRRIKAVDDAIRKVPRPIRAETALVAGGLLGAHAMPVRRTHYSQVSAPVPVYRPGW